MSCNTSTTSSLGGGQPQMDKRLLKASISGDSTSMKEMASQDPSILLGTTPSGNICLHLSSIHGHEGFCKDVLELSRKKRVDVLELEESLLSKSNFEQETPLVSAVTHGHASLASFLLRRCCELELRQAISRQDKDGCNALHYAIRGGHRDLALELIAEEPALSQGVSKNNDSPMFVAVMRGFTDVAEKLLEIPDSAHGGNNGYNAMHGATRNGNSVFTKRILETRPGLAKEANKDGYTPLTLAVYLDKIDVLRVFLEHDCSLGYQRRIGGFPLLHSAAFGGHVDVAQELLKHCPDAPYRNIDEHGWTCLHTAVWNDHAEFVEFILRTPQLSKLVNMQESKGKTALHYAVQKCNPKIVAALLSQKDIDTTVIDNCGWPAAWELSCVANHAKTLNWNEVIMLMLRADPQDATCILNINMRTKRQATDASRNDAKSLMQTYTSNTSLVAILIATITFTAAFTLPGGYSNDAGSEGLPIMSKKFALQAFLIFDTLAMCSSFAVAFICIIARWEDYEFLIHYISSTKKLMWFAYVSTTMAFSTGLYTVLATRLRWLAIAICVLVVLLPLLTKLLGEWPVLKLRFRLGKTFNSELLEMV